RLSAMLVGCGYVSRLGVTNSDGKKITARRRIQLYRLYVEDCVRHAHNDIEILGPTLRQILEAVRRLNGKNTAPINIDLGSKHLTISGGNEGCYIAFLTHRKRRDISQSSEFQGAF